MTNNKYNLASLADELGAVRSEINELKARESSLHKQILTSGEDFIEGATHRAFVTRSTRTRRALDVEAIRAEMGDDWVNAHYTETETMIMVIVRRAP